MQFFILIDISKTLTVAIFWKLQLRNSDTDQLLNPNYYVNIRSIISRTIQ